MVGTSSTVKDRFDVTSGSFLITDTHGEVVYANKGIEQRTGYTVAEVVGRGPGDLWGGNMDATFYTRLWDTILKQKHPFVGAVRNQTKSGQSQCEFLHIAPLYDSAGIVQYFIEIHPIISQDTEGAFQQEFQHVFSHQQQYAQSLLSWVARQLHIPLASSQLAAGDTIRSVQRFFIQPTAEQFIDRYEDRALIRAAQEEHAAFQHLYDKYQAQVFSYFLPRLGYDASKSEDFSQETFLRAYKHLDGFEIGNANYLTYLLRIAHNLLVNFYRKEQALSLEEQDIEIVDDSHQQEYAVLIEQFWEAGHAVLSEAEKNALELKYQHGYRVSEIAAVLNKSENAVKLLLSRGRKKLSRHYLA